MAHLKVRKKKKLRKKLLNKKKPALVIWEIHRLFSWQRDADDGRVTVWTGCSGKKGTCVTR